jgi:hypothetical protein
MKFQRRHWLEDFAWRVERVTQKFRLSSVSFLSVYLFSVTGMIAQLVERRASNPEVAV